MTFVNTRYFVVNLTACVLTSLLVAGCASYRVDTSLQPRTPSAPMPADVQFRVAAVNFIAPTNVPSGGLPPFGSYQPGNEEIRNKLMASAKEAYPKVFSEQAAAIPLEVTITRSANTTDLGGEACASCLTLTILPLRSMDKTDYTVQVQVKEGPASETLAAPITFSREDTSWLSILPTGWIPVPSGKGARAWGMDSAIQKGGDLTLSSCVEAIVTAIRRVDVETWQKLRPGTMPDEKK
jgi:hypothetical protein